MSDARGELIAHLEHSLVVCERFEDAENWASWPDQMGVLLTRGQAKLALAAIRATEAKSPTTGATGSDND